MEIGGLSKEGNAAANIVLPVIIQPLLRVAYIFTKGNSFCEPVNIIIISYFIFLFY
jgi:hypothetical protein